MSVSEASKPDEGISEEGPIIHFGRNSREVLVVLGPLELGLLEGKEYSATVDVQGPTGSVLSAGSYCGVTVTGIYTVISGEIWSNNTTSQNQKPHFCIIIHVI